MRATFQRADVSTEAHCARLCLFVSRYLRTQRGTCVPRAGNAGDVAARRTSRSLASTTRRIPAQYVMRVRLCTARRYLGRLGESSVRESGSAHGSHRSLNNLSTKRDADFLRDSRTRSHPRCTVATGEREATICASSLPSYHVAPYEQSRRP